MEMMLDYVDAKSEKMLFGLGLLFRSSFEAAKIGCVGACRY